MEGVEVVQGSRFGDGVLPGPELQRAVSALGPEVSVEQDDSDDDDDPYRPSAPVPVGLVARPVFRYHAVVNGAVEHQLVALLASPCALYFLVSAAFLPGDQAGGPTYREVYMHLTLPIEAVRIAMPAVPNIGYVWGEFQATFQPDEQFARVVQARWSQ